MLYSITFVLDLRAKMKGFTIVIRNLAQLTNTDYSTHLIDVRVLLSILCSKYEDKFGALSLKGLSLTIL